MSARHKARKRALDFLFESDIRKKDALELLNARGEIDLSEKEYVIQLVTGVGSHRDRIDELIIAYAEFRRPSNYRMKIPPKNHPNTLMECLPVFSLSSRVWELIK